MRNFSELLKSQWQAGRFLCVGLDSQLDKLPDLVRKDSARETLVTFNRAIVDATKEVAGSYKLNSAFYEAHGDEGFAALRESIRYIQEIAPETPVIVDAKRADIGNTNQGYIDAVFGYLHADAITVHPYLGREALEPFLAQKEKGIIVLCRTSNAGAGELQDLKIEGQPLYQVVAERAATEWNGNSNIGLVVGATYPQEMKAVRAIAADLPILVPGVGAQNGDLAAAVRAGKDTRGQGLMIAASRAVIFASNGADFAEAAETAAQDLHRQITAALIQ